MSAIPGRVGCCFVGLRRAELVRDVLQQARGISASISASLLCSEEIASSAFCQVCPVLIPAYHPANALHCFCVRTLIDWRPRGIIGACAAFNLTALPYLNLTFNLTRFTA